MWSIIMEPGKTYSTVVEKTFHLSMATLDIASVKKADDIHTVYIETNDGPRVILCHLSKSSNMFQCALDHVITTGTDLKFVTSATANIHMTGYVDDLDEEDDEDQIFSDLESQEEEEEEETQISKKQSAVKGGKRKAENSFSKKPKSIKLDEIKSTNSDDDDEDEDESDETLDFEDDSDNGLTVSDMFDDEAESDDEVEDYDEDDDEDNEEESDESDDEVQPQSTKKAKINGNEQKTPKKEQKTPLKSQEKTPKTQEKTPKAQDKTSKGQKTPDANKSLINGTTESNKKKKNKEPKTPLDGLKTKPDTPLPKDKLNQQQKLNGGVIISDIKVGDGAVAKPGKNVKVYYVGRLKSTGKVFDSMQKGPGFSFGLQRGEVIKGWDIGIAGMRVGGKRKVICPPNMAYGAKGSPPEIPPNSTLVFDVELKHIN